MGIDKKYQVRVDSKSSVPIMHLSGEITAFSDEGIKQTYKGIELTAPPKLIVNFDGARYINSAGIATLVGIVTDMVEKKGTVKFVGLAPHYRKVVEIVGITEYVKIYDTVAEALEEIE